MLKKIVYLVSFVLLLVLAYPMVYWIVSFTEYYRAARPPSASRPQPTSPPTGV